VFMLSLELELRGRVGYGMGFIGDEGPDMEFEVDAEADVEEDSGPVMTGPSVE
jgi:hypothetical protein